MERLSVWESPVLSRFFMLVLAIAIAWIITTWPFSQAALFIFGSILLLLAFLKPRWALYTLPFTVPFGSIREVPVGPAMVGGTEVLLACFLIGWACRGIARRELYLLAPRQWRYPPLWDPILLWYGVMLLSVSQSSSFADSMKELVKWGETFALYAIAVHELRRRDMVIIITMTLAAGTLAAVEGIYQSLWLVGPESFKFPIGNQILLRAYGRFTQPNPYAGYLGMVLPLAYALVAVMRQPQAGSTTQRVPPSVNSSSTSIPVAVSRQETEDRWLLSPTLSLPPFLSTRSGILLWAKRCSVIMFMALFLSLSRGGWIAGVLAAAVVAKLFFNRRPIPLLLLITGVFTTFAALGGSQILPGVVSRVSSIVTYINFINIDLATVGISAENHSILERLAHWDAGIKMWADSPWLGQGIGNYEATYPIFRTPPWEQALGHAHNLLINTLAETGALGLIAYLIFWISALRLAFEAVQRSSGLWRGIAIGIFAAMVHLHVHNFFDNLYVHGMYLHIALLLAIAAKLSQPDKEAFASEAKEVVI
ncbi:MAG: O-antigen ligase family protein [Ardenticatenaceae bacterium]